MREEVQPEEELRAPPVHQQVLPGCVCGGGQWGPGGHWCSVWMRLQQQRKCTAACLCVESASECGQHSCQELCAHSGHCPPAWLLSSIGSPCACRARNDPPPTPCGTPLPACEAPCQKAQPCGHPAAHPCHSWELPSLHCACSQGLRGGHVWSAGVCLVGPRNQCSQMCARMRQCQQHICQEDVPLRTLRRPA